MMLLFFPFKDESQLLPCCPPFYESKMQEQGVEDILNRNKINFKPYCDVVDQDFSQFNENSTSNQEPHSQIKNETPEVEYPNENYLEDRKKNFMRQILPDYEMTKDKNCLKLKQREVFNVVHT